MSLKEHYSGHKWIKVKKFREPDGDGTWKNEFIRLEEHHLKETTFLINEVRKLADVVDEKDKLIEELKKNQKEKIEIDWTFP